MEYGGEFFVVVVVGSQLCDNIHFFIHCDMVSDHLNFVSCIKGCGLICGMDFGLSPGNWMTGRRSWWICLIDPRNFSIMITYDWVFGVIETENVRIHVCQMQTHVLSYVVRYIVDTLYNCTVLLCMRSQFIYFFSFRSHEWNAAKNWALKYSDDNIRNWIFDTWVCECRRWSYTYVRTLYSIKFGRYSSTNYLDSSIFFIINLRIPCVVYHIQLKCIVICIVVNVSLLWCNLVVLLHHLFNWQFNIFPKMMDIYLYGDLARIWMIEFRGVSSFNLFQFSILMKTVYCLVGEPHSAISMNCLAKRFSSCQRPHKPLHSIHSQH